MSDIKIKKEVLEILEVTGTERSIVKDLEKINSDAYTLMYTSHDHEVCYTQANDIDEINRRLKQDSENHEGSWELEHIFKSGKPLKYNIHNEPYIEFIE